MIFNSDDQAVAEEEDTVKGQLGRRKRGKFQFFQRKHVLANQTMMTLIKKCYL